MSKTTKQGEKEKYSIHNPSPRLLQTLKDVQLNLGGSVSYVFVEEKIEFSEKYPLGKTIKLKSSTVAPINSAIFYKEIRGKIVRRTQQEILQVFEDTREDLGAEYFVIS